MYRGLVETARVARQTHRDASLPLRAVESVIARRRAAQLVSRGDRAQELATRYPEAPAGLPARDELADTVAAALKSWADRPTTPVLSGDSAAELREAIARLPALPEGDLRPAEAVEAAYRTWRAAVDNAALEADEPNVAIAPDTGGLTESDLRRLAADLGTGDPAVDPALVARVEAARRRLGAVERPPFAVLAVGAAATAGVAALLLVMNAPLGPAVAAGAAALALLALAVRRRSERAAAALAFKVAEADLEPARLAAGAARARRAEAERALSAAGLTAEADGVVRAADALAAHVRSIDEHTRWTERTNKLTSAVITSADTLRELLVGHGVAKVDDLDAAHDAYSEGCAERLAQRADALRADSLRQALKAREEAEASAAAAESRRAAAEDDLRKAAARAGLDGTAEPDGLVKELEALKEARATSATEAETALREWEELQALLSGGTLADLERQTDQQLKRAAGLAAGLDAPAIGAVRLEADPDAQVAGARQRLASLATAADQAEAKAEAAARGARSVAEADESLARAAADLSRLESAAQVLDRSIAMLESAQHRVHRDLAPILAGAIRPRLASVTAGRYVDVAVDPGTLEVRIKEAPGLAGHWRAASSVSRGTQEQVYLLLRAAMAEHLVTTDEVAPLILDEVTAQSDDARAAEVLATLLELSQERQVILFTHDETVVEWARVHLGTRDLLRELQEVGAPS